MSFDAIPVLDLSLSRHPDTKPAFLDSLRNALLDVGFLYIKNTGIDDTLIQDVIEQGKAFFSLPEEQKLEVQMKNVPSFLGYNKLGNEITALKTDWREQIDLSTPHPLPTATSPLYHNLLAPNQWPDSNYLPKFQSTFETYIARMSNLSTHFTSLIAESLNLPSSAFDRFFDKDQQHKLKIVKYPDTASLPSSDQTQGVGPHKDSMLTSYLLQVPPHNGLQAQNLSGDWIDCPPIPFTLVVAIGQGLEAITHGVCKSTTHRVLSPQAGLGPRFSVPFFQGVSYDATFESVEIPAEILELRDERLKQRGGQRIDDVEFTFTKGRWGHLGEATLVNRVKSHVDVGERWYPDILAQIRAEQTAAKVEAEERLAKAGAPQAGGQAVGVAEGSQAIRAH
ncbi:naringenin 3-dioxygenase [Usnea florida]